MGTVKNRFRELMREKSQRDGRKINYEIVAAETGMAYSTVAKWAGNKITRFDEKQILIFCEYFDCELSDLLVVVDEQSPETESPLVAIA